MKPYVRAFLAIVAGLAALALGGLGACAIDAGAKFDSSTSGAPIKEFSFLLGFAQMAGAFALVFLIVRLLTRR